MLSDSDEMCTHQHRQHRELLCQYYEKDHQRRVATEIDKSDQPAPLTTPPATDETNARNERSKAGAKTSMLGYCRVLKTVVKMQLTTFRLYIYVHRCLTGVSITPEGR